MILSRLLLHSLVSFGALSLAACSEHSAPREQAGTNIGRGNQVAGSAVPGATDSQRAEQAPFLAVNELKRALLPLGPTMGDVAVEKDCVVFTRRGERSTPLWPFGTRLARDNGRWTVKLPDGASIALPSRATLTGAETPLNSHGMTKFSGALGEGCPSRIYAVTLN